MSFLYALAIALYGLGLRAASLFHHKARAWVAGRKNWEQRLSEQLSQPGQPTQPLVWMHCASLGEFEQGRPVLESLRATYPNIRIVLTFFSPSGYALRKDYPHADLVAYLPLDTARNARIWTDLLNPQLVIFVKYEFWYHYLSTLNQRGIPTLLISALFRTDQVFFKPWGGLFRKMLGFFEHIFVQDARSADALHGLGITQVTIAGDNRIDRVASLAEAAPDYPLVARFASGHPVWVIGSNWPEDDRILLPFLIEELPPRWKAIIAPHDLKPAYLEKLDKALGGRAIRYSRATPAQVAKARFLLIDNVGMLAGIYRYGKIAYIGGGFGAGIHNTLEPAAHGLPVIFGPRHKRFREAADMKAQNAAFTVSSQDDLQEVFGQLQGDHLVRAGDLARAYIAANKGATAQVMQYIRSHEHLGLGKP